MVRYTNLLAVGIILAILALETLQHGTESLSIVATMGAMTGLVLIGIIRTRESSREIAVRVSVKEMTEVPPRPNHRHGLIVFDGVTLSNRSFRQRKYLEFRLRMHRPDGEVEVYHHGSFIEEGRATPVSCFLGGPLVLNPWWRSPGGREGTLGFLTPETSLENRRVSCRPEAGRQEIVVVDLLSGRSCFFPLDCDRSPGPGTSREQDPPARRSKRPVRSAPGGQHRASGRQFPPSGRRDVDLDTDGLY